MGNDLINLLFLFPYWSQAIFFLGGAFGGFFVRVSNDIYDHWKAEELKKKNYDSDLFKIIQKKIAFVKNCRNEKFDGKFHKEDTISPVFNFVDYDMIDPAYTFFDKKGETIKMNLFNKIKELSNFISSGYTDDIGEEYQGIPSRWEYEQPKKYIEGQKILSTLPNETWNEYLRFLEYGKRRFKI